MLKQEEVTIEKKVGSSPRRCPGIPSVPRGFSQDQNISFLFQDILGEKSKTYLVFGEIGVLEDMAPLSPIL